MLGRIIPLKVSFWLLVVALLLWTAAYTGGDNSCPVVFEKREVNGSSLAGFIESGAEVQIAFGYYSCNEVAVGDVVIYDDAGEPRPLIKRVQAIAGDSFALAFAEGGVKILVNNQVLKNSNGEPYRISTRAYELLSLYERDYGGFIPKGALLLLGNTVSGSRDSTEFGFASSRQLLGKVIKVVPAE